VAKTERIGVLAGGDSPEREVSLVSGDHVHRALLARGYLAELLDLKTLDDLFGRLAETDRVFNCLHGGAGEDGTVQLLLDLMKLPYTGSGARACARAMDKTVSKAIFETMRIPTPPGLALGESTLDPFLARVSEAFDPPYVVKPTDLGSTIGVAVVDEPGGLRDAIAEAKKRHGSALVEPFIEGREVTVGILDENGKPTPLPVIEIRMPSTVFDYEAKYTEGIAEFLVPADLPEDVTRSVQDAAVRAHEVLGCAGYSRVDLRLSEDGTPFVLEVNAIPGMTEMSDLPRAAAAAGIGFEDLVERMLASAVKEDA